MFLLFLQVETAKTALKYSGILLLRQVLRSKMEELFNLTQNPTDTTGANGTGSINICPNFKISK